MKLTIAITLLAAQSQAIKIYGAGNGKDPMGIHGDDKVESVYNNPNLDVRGLEGRIEYDK